MKTIHEKLVYAFGYSEGDFDVWKRALRNFDITCDVINALDGIPQGTKYHPEFDALKHVWYVCRAVMEMGRDDLLEAAFLHDYGKAKRTNIGSDRIYHFGHPKESVKFIDKIKMYLKDYELARRLSDDHMKYSADNKHLVDDKDLADFVVADKELGKAIFEREATEAVKDANKLKEKAVYLKQRSSKKNLYVMVGIPGSGKSRYLKSVDPKLVVSSDGIRRELFGNVNTHRTNEISAMEVWNTAKARLRCNLELYGEAYLDACNVHKFFRVEFLSPFSDCRKTAIVFEVDEDTAIERVRKDIKDEVDRSDVPKKAIKKMAKFFKQGEKSLEHEFNEVIYWREE